MKSAVARLQATGMLQTIATRSSAFNVRVVRMRLQRVPQEDQDVDLALGEAGADLLVAAVGAAPEAGNGQAKLLGQQMAGRGGCEQVVSVEEIEVVLGPLQHVPFLIVVRDQGDPPPRRRRCLVGNVCPPGSVVGLRARQGATPARLDAIPASGSETTAPPLAIARTCRSSART